MLEAAGVRLDLTPEQVEKIKPMMEQHHEEMTTFREQRRAEDHRSRFRIIDQDREPARVNGCPLLSQPAGAPAPLS